MSVFLNSIFDSAVEKFTWSWQQGKDIDNRVTLPLDEKYPYQYWIDSLFDIFHVLDASLYKRSLISTEHTLFMNSRILQMVSKINGYLQPDVGVHMIGSKWMIHEEPHFPDVILVVNRNVLDAIKTGIYATVNVIDWDMIPTKYRA